MFSQDRSIAQTTVETLLILAISITIMLFLVSLVNDNINTNYLTNENELGRVAVNSLSKEINNTYFGGPGNSRTVIIRMPSLVDLNASSIEGRQIFLRVGNNDFIASTDVDVRGEWPNSSGSFVFELNSFEDFVLISPKKIGPEPSGVNVVLNQGDSSSFSIVLHNYSDSSVSYSLDINNLSSGAVVSSAQASPFSISSGDDKEVSFSVLCSAGAIGAYYGKIIFYPPELDANISVPIRAVCSSAQEKLLVFPLTKSISASANTPASSSVSVCNASAAGFNGVVSGVSGAAAEYVFPGAISSIPAGECSVLLLAVRPKSAGSYSGTLNIESAGYSASASILLTVS